MECREKMHKMNRKMKTPHSNKGKDEKKFLWCENKREKSIKVDGEVEEM